MNQSTPPRHILREPEPRRSFDAEHNERINRDWMDYQLGGLGRWPHHLAVSEKQTEEKSDE